MAIFAQDTIGGTNGQELSATTPSGGGTWTKNTAFGTNQALIFSNRVRQGPAAGSNDHAAYYHSGTPASAEYDVEADVQIVQMDTGYTFSIMGRMSTSVDTGYRLGISGNTYELYKNVAGVRTSLGTWQNTGLANGTSHHMLLQIRDATKKAFINGVERISSTDNVITAAGKAGVHVWGAFDGADDWGYHGDNFIAQDPGGAAVNIDPNFIASTSQVFVPEVSTVVSATVSGSILSSTTEADIVAGGRKAIITLAGTSLIRGELPFPIAPSFIQSASQVFVPSFTQPETALDFPGNFNYPSDSIVDFLMWNQTLGGITVPPMTPMTIIMKHYVKASQDGYWSHFFYAQNWANGAWNSAPYNYHGEHPYPDPPPTGAEKWEISGAEIDALSGAVTFGVWRTSVFRVGTDLLMEYWPDWPSATNKVTLQDAFRGVPTDPMMCIGQAPWSLNREIPNSRIRYIFIYTEDMPDADITSEIANPGGIYQPWFAKANPKPDDILDESGDGHHPIWILGDPPNINRPALWTP